MHVQWIDSETDFEALAPEWDRLLADSDADHPFLSWRWMFQWWRHYGSGHRLALMAVREAGQLVGLAPLYLTSPRYSWRARVLRFLGTGEVCSEYLGFILQNGRQDEAAAAILEFLHGEVAGAWDLMELRDLPDGAAMQQALLGRLEAGDWTWQRRPGWVYYLVDLPDSWEAFLKSVSKNRREQIRRALRDMDRQGARFEEVTRVQDLPEAWSHLKRLHQMRWTTRGQAGCFASSRFERFHQSLLEPLLARGELCLGLLRTDDAVIGASYSLRRHGHVYFYQSGIDPAWLPLRPGHAMRALEFQLAIGRGDRLYDFLGGDMDYKRQWATRVTPTTELVIGAPRPAGRLHFARRLAAQGLKRYLKRLAPTWRPAWLGRPAVST